MHVHLITTLKHIKQILTWLQGELGEPTVEVFDRSRQKNNQTRYTRLEQTLSKLDLLSVWEQEREMNMAGGDCGLLKSTWNIYKKDRLLDYEASLHRYLNQPYTGYNSDRLEIDF